MYLFGAGSTALVPSTTWHVDPVADRNGRYQAHHIPGLHPGPRGWTFDLDELDRDQCGHVVDCDRDTATIIVEPAISATLGHCISHFGNSRSELEQHLRC